MGIADQLRRGLAAGAAAGLAAAVMLWLYTERAIERALVIEEARAAAEESGHSHSHGEAEAELVSRGQQLVGGMLTALLVALLFGLVFAVAYTALRHRLPGAGDHTKALALAGIGFAVFALVPALKIPANPPAVGDPESVNQRTLIYVGAIVIAVALVVAVFALDKALAARGTGAAERTAAGVLLSVVGLIGLFALVPNTPDSIPHDVPADLIWDFRLASLAQLAVMWLVLGTAFGLLAGRTRRAETAQRETVAA